MPDSFIRPNEQAADLFTLKYANMQDWINVAEQNNLALKVQQAVSKSRNMTLNGPRQDTIPPWTW